MEEIERTNKILLFLFGKINGIAFALIEEMPTTADDKWTHVRERILIQLYLDDLIAVKETSRTGGGINRMYALKFNGISLCSNLPADFKDNPYGYFQYQKKVKADKEAELNQTLIDTNLSVKSVNKWFYLTLVIAAAGVAFQLITLRRDIRVDKLEKELQGKNTLITQAKSQRDSLKSLSDSLLNLKDSLPNHP